MFSHPFKQGRLARLVVIAGSSATLALSLGACQTTNDITGSLGEKSEVGASSTDSNVPIGLGIPAITIDGGGRGFGAHALSERYEDGPRGWLGPQWAALIVTSLAGVR